MLIEKHRPTTFEDFVGHEQIVKQLKTQIKNKQFQHQLFYGGAGLGKTTLAHVIAKALYGEGYKRNFFEFNASMDRGIDMIRNDIGNLAKRSMGFGNIQFKIIFLDEADSLTKDAQHALRRLMEEYHKQTIFVISCVAYDTKIYTPYGFRRVQNIQKEQVLTHKSVEINQALVLSKKKKLLKIKTLHGLEIDVTPEHKFLNCGKWVQAKDLQKHESIDIDIRSLFGNDLELTNQKLQIFNKQFIQDFSNWMVVDKKRPTKKIIDYIVKHRKKYALPQVVDLYNKLEFGVEYSMADISSIDNDKLKKHRYGNITKQLRELGALEKKHTNTNTKFIKIDKNLHSLGFNKMIEAINKEFEIQYSINDILYIYRHHHTFFNVDRVLDRLENVLNINTLQYDKVSALGRIMGYLYGDGHMTKNGGLYFAASNDDTLIKIRKDMMLLLDCEEKSMIIGHNGPQDSKGRGMWYKERILGYLFEYLGVPAGAKVSQTLKIPHICYSDKLLMKSFLQSVFDCECSNLKILPTNNKSVKNWGFGQRILKTMYKTQSRGFMDEVSDVLKHWFGIYNVIKNEDIDRDRDRDIKVKNLPKRISRSVCIMRDEDKIKIYQQIGSYYENYKIHYDILGYLKYKSYQRGYNFLCFDDWKIKHFKDDKIIDRIVSVEEKEGEFDVYDLSMKKTHSYISNGFISHNCNYIEKILDPIKSRCNVCQFNRLLDNDIKINIRNIANKENINLSVPNIKTILNTCNGDLRKAINMLEKVKDGGNLDDSHLYNQQLLKLSLEELIDLSFQEDPDKLLRKIHTEILNNKDYKGLVKVAATDYKMALMTNKVLQLQDLIVCLKDN